MFEMYVSLHGLSQYLHVCLPFGTSCSHYNGRFLSHLITHERPLEDDEGPLMIRRHYVEILLRVPRIHGGLSTSEISKYHGSIIEI